MLRIDEQFVQNILIKEGGLKEINSSIHAIQSYRMKKYKSKKGNLMTDKNRRLAEWLPTLKDIEEIVICVWTAVLVNENMTYQTIAGMLNHKIKVEELIDRVRIISEVIAIISKSGLINITSYGSGKNIVISTDWDLEENIPIVEKHGLVLHRPQPVESNFDPEQGNMLLGSNLNYHEGELCLHHLIKLNNIPLRLNREFLQHYTETSSNEFDTQEKQDQWDLFVNGSAKKYQELLEGGNCVYENHKYCTRGRSYAIGYYINTQGSSYKKAIVQLANLEYVNIGEAA